MTGEILMPAVGAVAFAAIGFYYVRYPEHAKRWASESPLLWEYQRRAARRTPASGYRAFGWIFWVCCLAQIAAVVLLLWP